MVQIQIHRIRRLIIASIDDPYSLEQLMSPRINVNIIRPLVDRLYDPKDISVVYCLLVNRARFMKDQVFLAHHQTVNMTRASLCELLATRVLRRFNEDNPGRNGLLVMANILVSGFEPFQNCPDDVLISNRHLLNRYLERSKDSRGKTTNALELAILSEAKHFVSATACQRVIESIYHGRVVYTPNSLFDIIPDHYKHKNVSLYDPRKAPMLNHYRLIVPRTRSILECAQFLLLLTIYIFTMISRNRGQITTWEILWIVYGFGWVLDGFSSMCEHGWHVYSQNLWSFLDVTVSIIYFVYVIVRFHGWALNDDGIGIQALDVLACAAPIMLPRLAFNLMPESMLFISLRAMMKDFLVLTGVAIWCFGGFLLGMAWLSRWRGAEEDPIPPILISKWMLWIWFGLDGTGITHSTDFHLILGPILMISFTFLGNTLFLTILVSMLTNTFGKIAADANAEIQFRRAVITFEGAKSDAIFAYMPPFNIAAVVLLLPFRFILTPRWFHKIHVTAVRVLNAPILILISIYERKRLWQHRKTPLHASQLKRRNESILTALFGGSFQQHRDLQDVFDVDVPECLIQELEDEDTLDEGVFDVGFQNTRERSLSPGKIEELRRRRFSAIS